MPLILCIKGILIFVAEKVLFLGDGVAGITAAIRRAARSGLSVSLVEKKMVSGVHVNWGEFLQKRFFQLQRRL